MDLANSIRAAEDRSKWKRIYTPKVMEFEFFFFFFDNFNLFIC